MRIMPDSSVAAGTAALELETAELEISELEFPFAADEEIVRELDDMPEPCPEECEPFSISMTRESREMRSCSK